MVVDESMVVEVVVDDIVVVDGPEIYEWQNIFKIIKVIKKVKCIKL